MNFLRPNIEPLPQRKRQRRKKSSATTLLSDGTPQEIHGDLLSHASDYLVHQTNCTSTGARGLAQHVFHKYPFANTYRTNDPCRQVGTVSLHRCETTTTAPTIVNLYGQYGTGTNKKNKKVKVKDDKETRENYFRLGLIDLENKLQRDAKQNNNIKATVAFPFGIGCNLAGGDWSTYRTMISRFATRNQTIVDVVIIQLNDTNMKAFNDKARTPGKFEKKVTTSSTNIAELRAKAQARANRLSGYASSSAASGEHKSHSPLSKNTLVRINGSHGEGGGQIMRISLALSSITKYNLNVTNIRAGRSVPGLRNQHVSCIELVGKMMGQGTTQQACQVGTKEFLLSYGAAPTPTPANDATVYHIDTKSAASITLLIQACLPVQIARCLQCNQSTAVTLIGGTDVSFSPPMDHVSHVLLPVLRKHYLSNISIDLKVNHRGYYPQGGGSVTLTVSPTTTTAPCTVNSFQLVERGLNIVSLFGVLRCHGITSTALTNLQDTFQQYLIDHVTLEEHEKTNVTVECHTSGVGGSGVGGSTHSQQQNKNNKNNKNSKNRNKNTNKNNNSNNSNKRRPNRVHRAIVCQLVAVTNTGCYLSSNCLRQLKKAKSDEPPTFVRKKLMDVLSEACTEMNGVLASGTCVDEHTSDQLLVYMALERYFNAPPKKKQSSSSTGSTGSIILTTPCRMSQHSNTAMDIISQNFQNIIQFKVQNQTATKLSAKATSKEVAPLRTIGVATGV